MKKHDPLCLSYISGLPDVSSPCNVCALIARVRSDEQANAIKILSGAYVTDEYQALIESPWNTAISTALEYLREEYGS